MNQGETATFFCNASGIGDLAIGCKGVDTGGGGGGLWGLKPPPDFQAQYTLYMGIHAFERY